MQQHTPPAVLGLMSEALRWQLVAELGRSDRRVGELVELTGKPQNLVSYHLAELRRAGIVSARRSSADRRDVYYSADLVRCRDLLCEAGVALHPAMRLAPAGDRHVSGRSRRVRVLFLCTGNSARSQMAEAIVEHRFSRLVSARSAGSHPKPLHPYAVRVMAERGIDIDGRRSKAFNRFARERFDRVITLCDRVREVCPEFPGTPTVAHWSIADPAAGGASDEATYEAFRRVAADLERRIDLLMADLTEHEGITHA